MQKEVGKPVPTGSIRLIFNASSLLRLLENRCIPKQKDVRRNINHLLDRWDHLSKPEKIRAKAFVKENGTKDQLRRVNDLSAQK